MKNIDLISGIEHAVYESLSRHKEHWNQPTKGCKSPKFNVSLFISVELLIEPEFVNVVY